MSYSLGKSSAKQAGATFYSLLVSIAIIGIAVSASYLVLRRSMSLEQESRQIVKATKIAQSQIADIKYRLAIDPNFLPTVDSNFVDKKFCLNPNNTGVLEITNQSPCQQDGLDIEITYTPKKIDDPQNPGTLIDSDFPNTFNVRVIWLRTSTFKGRHIDIQYRSWKI